MCKACFSAYMKARAVAKGDELRAKGRASYYAHREARLAKVNEYRQKNPEKVKQSQAAKYQKHREEYAAINKKWQERNKESMREYHRHYYWENREKLIAKTREYAKTPRGKIAIRQTLRNQRQKNKHKCNARQAVRWAVLAGTLIKPEGCQECGTVGRVQAHHHLGYEQPHWLHVQWLCRRCHDISHGKIPLDVN
jgi:hypothetical protein